MTADEPGLVTALALDELIDETLASEEAHFVVAQLGLLVELCLQRTAFVEGTPIDRLFEQLMVIRLGRESS